MIPSTAANQNDEFMTHTLLSASIDAFTLA